MYRQKEKVDDAYPLHRMRKKQMEHTWTKEFYQETDPAKRQQILKEHIGEEEAWEQNPALDSSIRTAQAPEG